MTRAVLARMFFFFGILFYFQFCYYYYYYTLSLANMLVHAIFHHLFIISCSR